MPTRAALVALGLTIVACGSSTAATTATAKAPCGPASAKTLAADRVARIYQAGGEVYGCASRGHRYKLGASSRTTREGRVGPVALAGRDAAYGLASYGVDTGSANVVVRRLSDGAQLHNDPSITQFSAVEAYQTVDAVVVKADGSVAWIAGEQSIVQHGSTIEVQKHDSHGASLLDQSSGIDTHSLRLHASRLSWHDAGRTRTATLR